MSTTQYLSGAATRHQVFLQRYGGGQSKEAASLLFRIRREIAARLAMEPTDFQKARLEAVLFDINAITAAGFKDIEHQQIKQALELASSEANTSVKLFNRAVKTEFKLPSEGSLISAVMMSGMSVEGRLNTGITIEGALQKFGHKKSKQIAQIISDGVVLGDTTPVITNKVSEVINTLQRRQLDSLVRTITNNASSIARNQTYHANSDIMEGYKWIATLDSRTTLICGSRDGKIFQEGDPMPPAHYNCRSTTIPVIKPEYDIGSKLHGERPAKGAKGTERVSARTSYGGWLKEQPTHFIDEALGIEKSALFRSGKLTLDKFVDPTGRVYTLLDLERMNPIAFAE